MPFRPLRSITRRMEAKRLRRLYSISDDEGKRAVITHLLKHAPCEHVGEFVILNTAAFPRIAAPTVVFHVPTGKFRTDQRSVVDTTTWIQRHLTRLQEAFNRKA